MLLWGESAEPRPPSIRLKCRVTDRDSLGTWPLSSRTRTRGGLCGAREPAPWKSLGLKHKAQAPADGRTGLHALSPGGSAPGGRRALAPHPAPLRPDELFPALGTSTSCECQGLAPSFSRAGFPPDLRPGLPTPLVARAPPLTVTRLRRAPRPAPRSGWGLRSGWVEGRGRQGGVGWGVGAVLPAAPSTSSRRAAVPEPGSPFTITPAPPHPRLSPRPQEGQGRGPTAGAHGSGSALDPALGMLCFSRGRGRGRAPGLWPRVGRRVGHAPGPSTAGPGNPASAQLFRGSAGPAGVIGELPGLCHQPSYNPRGIPFAL